MRLAARRGWMESCTSYALRAFSLESPAVTMQMQIALNAKSVIFA